MKTKVYYNTFENGLDAFDDGTYTTQSANGRFRSPYDDHAYGARRRVRHDAAAVEHAQGRRLTTGRTSTPSSRSTGRPIRR